MATVYDVEVVSYWRSYSKDELQKLLEEAVKQSEKEKGNTIHFEVKEKY